jgi:hypothetical protein
MSVRFFKALLFLHRWIGIAACLLFLLWFPSGIGMMYWGMPSVTATDRLARAPVLDPARVQLSPAEAAARVGLDALPNQVRLNSFDGRPVYRFAGGRGGAGGLLVYADTGEEQTDAASDAMRVRAVEAWTGRPVSSARVAAVTEPDQWTVGNSLRNTRPLYKYSYPGGDDVYIGDSGEVLMYTTRLSRLQAYVSAVPHWLYFTPLRKHQVFWIRFATYAAMIGTVGAVVGVVLGLRLYSPSKKKYRYEGAPSSIPYRGQKRWHTVLGLIFGLATVTWTLSGSLAFLPFPAPERARPQVTPGQNTVGGVGRARGQSGGPRGEGAGQGVRQGAGRAAGPGTGQQAGAPRGRGGPQALAASLRGRARLDDFAPLPPRDLLARHRGLAIKELELASFFGRPHYVATLADGSSRRFDLNGERIEHFDAGAMLAAAKQTAVNPAAVETRVVEQYDYYYFDRTRKRPLPVVLALMHDADGTRHYMDPMSGTVAGTYSDRNWARRFFYNGLHSLSFPWLYNYRPLWDIVVIVFMVGGTALCVTALVLAWQALGKRLAKMVTRPAASPRLSTTIEA